MRMGKDIGSPDWSVVGIDRRCPDLGVDRDPRVGHGGGARTLDSAWGVEGPGIPGGLRSEGADAS